MDRRGPQPSRPWERRSNSPISTCSSSAWPSRGKATMPPWPRRRWPTACQRMADREAATAKLIAAMSPAATPVKCRFLEILAKVGGAGALQALGAAVKDADPQIQDTASRLLGEWMDVDAGPVLLDLAKNAADEKYKIRALRGYIRLVRQFDMPDDQRAEMCRAALRDRPADRGEETGPGGDRPLSQRRDAVLGPRGSPGSRTEERGRGGGDDHRREDRRPVGRTPEDAQRDGTGHGRRSRSSRPSTVRAPTSRT